ncbi:MAG: hypothetical protein HDT11_01090 [Helicobacter sp.]|nr:hypothetical protein [Helicobacter sp.]
MVNETKILSIIKRDRITKVLGSFALFLTLNAGELSISERSVNTTLQQTTPTEKVLCVQKSYDYVALCSKILEHNSTLFLMLNESQNIGNFSKKDIKKLQKKLAEVIEVAQERIQNGNIILKQYDENVLYSSIALKELIRSLLSDNSCGYVEVEDIVAFGHGIFEAQRAFNV